ncbi:MAG: phosphoglucosamine mutase [Solirubrobacteraceae bacterium]
MTLIKSISGIRGTIGGKTNENFTPIDIVKFIAAYGGWLQKTQPAKSLKVIIGRDARISGIMVSQLVCATLQGMGIDVIDLGLSTTPTVEMMVTHFNASGGVILTASHNPKEWNALKLLNQKGEFINENEGKFIIELAEKESFEFSTVDELGKYETFSEAIELHINKILELPYVDIQAIKNKQFKVVIDAVNSTGGIAIPRLLDKLGVSYSKLYCEPNGEFPHDPEPLEKNLTEIAKKVKEVSADFGIVVDPDVDRLALINEDGTMFGEEYTLVAIADYLLPIIKSNTVSNLSSSRALKDVTEKHGFSYFASAVGEVNVVEKMKEVEAKIGGEGNGGIILADLHYGRDALVGIALFLSLLAKKNISATSLKNSYPQYFMAKEKIELKPETNVDKILEEVIRLNKTENINITDGVKIDFENEWVHLRKSNTEPIIRIYSESTSLQKANELAQRFIKIITSVSE